MAEKLFGGRYALVEELGDSLWRAEDRVLGREVSVRMLGEAESTAPAAAKLAHPNIARLFDHGEADGERYEVHEYVRGETLAERLEREPLSEAEAQSLAAEIQAALAYAASQGVGHGALTAASVLVDERGHARVRGFGAGAPADDEQAAAALLAALGVGAGAAEGTQAVAAERPAEERRRPRLAPFAPVLLGLVGGLAAAILTSGGVPGSPASPLRTAPTTTSATTTSTGDGTPAPVAPASSASTTSETTPGTTSETTRGTTAAATTAPAATTAAPAATIAPTPPRATTVATEDLPPPTTQEVPPPPPSTETLPATTVP